MAFFKILLLLCALCTTVHCLPAGRSEAIPNTKGGVLQVCSYYIRPKAGNMVLCLFCKGFDLSCFDFRPTTTTTPTPPTTSTSQPTTPTTQQTTPTAQTTTTATSETTSPSTTTTDNM